MRINHNRLSFIPPRDQLALLPIFLKSAICDSTAKRQIQVTEILHPKENLEQVVVDVGISSEDETRQRLWLVGMLRLFFLFFFFLVILILILLESQAAPGQGVESHVRDSRAKRDVEMPKRRRRLCQRLQGDVGNVRSGKDERLEMTHTEVFGRETVEGGSGCIKADEALQLRVAEAVHVAEIQMPQEESASPICGQGVDGGKRKRSKSQRPQTRDSPQQPRQLIAADRRSGKVEGFRLKKDEISERCRRDLSARRKIAVFEGCCFRPEMTQRR